MVARRSRSGVAIVSLVFCLLQTPLVTGCGGGLSQAPKPPAPPPGAKAPDLHLPLPGQAPGEIKVNEIDGAEMVWVPSTRETQGSALKNGAFLMGSDDLQQLVHPVELDGFWLYRTEVTYAQWEKFVKATGYKWPEAHHGDANRPVVGVRWEDAVAYAKWAEGRLPTEAEWEWAARGPEGRKYPWGNTWDESKLCPAMEHYDFYRLLVEVQDAAARRPKMPTMPVGSFPEGNSWCGACDLAGNVWEWCSDWYDNGYYAVSPRVNPGGPDKGEYHVVRGGSFHDDYGPPTSEYPRGAFRTLGINEGPELDNKGFRVVVVAARPTG